MTAHRKIISRQECFERGVKSFIAFAEMSKADRKNGTHKLLKLLRKIAKSYT